MSREPWMYGPRGVRTFVEHIAAMTVAIRRLVPGDEATLDATDRTTR